jgi:hypothetical protein
MAHGGKREGAGRPPKDEENKAKRLSVNALIAEFGSEEEALIHCARMAKEGDKQSYNYFKLLIEYAYGKPKETVSNIHNFTDFNLKDLISFD